MLCSLCFLTLEAQVSSAEEAKEVYDFVFGAGSGEKLGTVSAEDISNASLFVKELSEKSCQMGWIESLWRASVKPNATVKGVLKSFTNKLVLKTVATRSKKGKCMSL